MHGASSSERRPPGHEFLDKDIEATGRLLAEIKLRKPQSIDPERVTQEFLANARADLEEARRLRANGKNPQALRAIASAQTWLKAGAHLGLFDVGETAASPSPAKPRDGAHR